MAACHLVIDRERSGRTFPLSIKNKPPAYSYLYNHEFNVRVIPYLSSYFAGLLTMVPVIQPEPALYQADRLQATCLLLSTTRVIVLATIRIMVKQGA